MSISICDRHTFMLNFQIQKYLTQLPPCGRFRNYQKYGRTTAESHRGQDVGHELRRAQIVHTTRLQ